MHDLRFDHMQDEAESDLHTAVDPHLPLSRRRLLGGAAGFVLGASGLLVPEGGAAQRPGERIQNAPRDRKDRDRKDRNRKDRNRKDRNRKDRNDNGLQHCNYGLCKDVELNFYSGKTLTHQLEVWQETSDGNQRYLLRWPGQTVPPVRQLVKFTGSEAALVMVVFTPGLSIAPLYFRVLNPTYGSPPLLEIAQGSWSQDGPVNQGQVYYKNKPVGVDQRVHDAPGFFVDRSEDSPYHKIFYINAAD